MLGSQTDIGHQLEAESVPRRVGRGKDLGREAMHFLFRKERMYRSMSSSVLDHLHFSCQRGTKFLSSRMGG